MKLTSKEKFFLIPLFVLAGIGLYLGWKTFLFMTDDAFISFRYISNSILGHGYVWNPEPFRAVEGYTNFLWIVLLDLVWRLFRVSPPECANYISLAFSFLTITLTSLMTLKMYWSDRLRRYLVLFLSMILFAVLLNRTFLAWSSSGLETAMFNFFVTAWVYCGLFIRFSSKRWVMLISIVASCIYLTRPDGLLFVAATLAMLFVTVLLAKGKYRFYKIGMAFPMLVVAAHFAWRYITYGQWLPNTYYAKSIGVWPESGIRYFASFVLEYGLWFWFIITALFAVKSIIQKTKKDNNELAESEQQDDVSNKSDYCVRLIVVSTILLHLCYYTFVIGGDHFEYRVYSHLVPFIFVSFVWFLNKTQLRISTALTCMIIFVVLSLPVPWTHWGLSRHLNTRQETLKMHVPIAKQWPEPVRWYAECFDSLQSWLIQHFVCVRHQEHKINYEFLVSIFPERQAGLDLKQEGFPVFAFPAVGVCAWTLPHVNIIDYHGLNDYVVARIDVGENHERSMAHDREAPMEYVKGFMPNVQLMPGGKVIVHDRPDELTAEEIIECEANWAKKVQDSGE